MFSLRYVPIHMHERQQKHGGGMAGIIKACVGGGSRMESIKLCEIKCSNHSHRSDLWPLLTKKATKTPSALMVCPWTRTSLKYPWDLHNYTFLCAFFFHPYGSLMGALVSHRGECAILPRVTNNSWGAGSSGAYDSYPPMRLDSPV